MSSSRNMKQEGLDHNDKSETKKRRRAGLGFSLSGVLHVFLSSVCIVSIYLGIYVQFEPWRRGKYKKNTY